MVEKLTEQQEVLVARLVEIQSETLFRRKSKKLQKEFERIGKKLGLRNDRFEYLPKI